MQYSRLQDLKALDIPAIINLRIIELKVSKTHFCWYCSVQEAIADMRELPMRLVAKWKIRVNR